MIYFQFVGVPTNLTLRALVRSNLPRSACREYLYCHSVQPDLIDISHALVKGNLVHLLCMITSKLLLFSRQQISDSLKLKEIADDNFKFDEDDKKLSRWVENTVGKGEIAH